jgi:hypothetical protein
MIGLQGIDSICKFVYIGTEKQSLEPGDKDVGVGSLKSTRKHLVLDPLCFRQER